LLLNRWMNSLGIYISVPFCRAKCSYCNFASGVSTVSAHEQYVAQLCGEVRSARRRLSGAAIPEQVDSIYLGGGTPSMLSPALLGELAQTLRQEFTISPGAEITVECAPGQLDEPGLEAMLALGVNRISFGVQSLVDREAAATGRYHTRAVVLQDLERVRAAGVRNLSIDLIAGMPHQTAASWQESLEVLAATGVEHASVYMLEIDQDSRLGRELLAGGFKYHAPAVPSEELTADLYEAAIAYLEDQGLRQYEISNFTRGDSGSRHNLKYWRRQPYLGFGLDAHSMVRTPAGSALRFNATAVLAEYLSGSPLQDVRRLDSTEEMEEAWFLGLRLRAGVAWQDLATEFGRDRVELFEPVVRELCGLALLNDENGVVSLTRRGVLLSNDVFDRFLGVEELNRCPSLSL
jgi:oxygen-independent coproporphyrinogen-3 oxidase